MGMSRSEDILQAMVDGSDPSSLPEPQSRVESLLFALLHKINSDDGLSIHFCSADEYDHVSGVPTIENPSETMFYLVPTGSYENDMYDEWIYIEGNWERFGGGLHIANATQSTAGLMSASDKTKLDTNVYTKAEVDSAISKIVLEKYGISLTDIGSDNYRMDFGI